MPARCARSPDTISRLRSGIDVRIDDAELQLLGRGHLGQPPWATMFWYCAIACSI